MWHTGPIASSSGCPLWTFACELSSVRLIAIIAQSSHANLKASEYVMQLIIKTCDKLFVQKQRTCEDRGTEEMATRWSVTRVHEYLCMSVSMYMHTHANCLHVTRGLAAVEGESKQEGESEHCMLISSLLAIVPCCCFFGTKTCKYKNN